MAPAIHRADTGWRIVAQVTAQIRRLAAAGNKLLAPSNIDGNDGAIPQSKGDPDVLILLILSGILAGGALSALTAALGGSLVLCALAYPLGGAAGCVAILGAFARRKHPPHPTDTDIIR